MALFNAALINVGVTADDGTGDKLRTAGIKINNALTLLNTQLATNVYQITQVNTFSLGQVIQSTPSGYALATVTSGFVGVVGVTGTGAFSLVTNGLLNLPAVAKGVIYYLDPNNPGGVTTTLPSVPVPAYIGVDTGLAQILPYIVQGSAAVTSVAGRTGAITLTTSDVGGLGSAALQSSSAFDAYGSASTAAAACLQKANNLSDLSSFLTARSNLGLSSTATVTCLQQANNLSDLGSFSAARSNLGLASTATAVCLTAANNLSDLASTATAVTNLGVLSLGGGTMTGNLVLNGTPSATNQAATKGYVDQVAQGISWKNPVMAAPTVSITISNPATSTFDGYTASSGDRIGLVNQATASQNGIYIFNGSTSAMTRSTDMSVSADVPNATFFVEEGSTNVGKMYTCTTPAPITLGTTSLTFTAFATAVGSVTSVALSMPTGFTVSGSPVTSSGTLAVTTSLSGLIYSNAGAFGSVTLGSGLSLSGGTLSLTSIADSSVSGAVVYTAATNSTSINWSNGLVQELPITGNVTFTSFLNPVSGKAHVIVLKATGGPFTVTLNTSAGHIAPSASTTVTSGSKQTMSAVYDGTNYFWAFGTNLSTI